MELWTFGRSKIAQSLNGLQLRTNLTGCRSFEGSQPFGGQLSRIAEFNTGWKYWLYEVASFTGSTEPAIAILPAYTHVVCVGITTDLKIQTNSNISDL